MLAFALFLLMSHDVRAFDVWRARATYIKQTAIEGQPPVFEVAVYDVPMPDASSATAAALTWAREGVAARKDPPEVGVIVIPPNQIVAIETYVAE